MTIISGLPASPENVDVYIQGSLKRFTESDFFQRYQVKGINRIVQEKFNSLKQSRLLKQNKLSNLTLADRTFIRFSLEKNNAVIGQNYLIIPIVETGQDTGNNGYVAPKLSTTDALIFKAVTVMNYLSYHDVQQLINSKKLNFKHSVNDIYDISSLKTEIMSRYGQSRPNLSEHQIQNLGVGAVWFKWVGFVDKNQRVQYLKD